MSDRGRALSAVGGLNTALRRHFGALNLPSPQSSLEALHNWFHSLTQKVESIELSRQLIGAGEWARLGEIGQILSPGSSLVEVKRRVLRINLNAKDSSTLLLLLVEHLASSAKNVTDVYAVLLNELWQLGLQNPQTTLIRVSDQARQRNNAHPLIQVVNGLKPPGTWFSVAQGIRNACQHRDSTSILISRVGRNAAPCIDEDLCPGKGELDRSLENFCPWLADQVYQFIEDVGTALSANPVL